ncbi:hypothetical protein Tco_0494570 [Tanacetum coccineum]
MYEITSSEIPNEENEANSNDQGFILTKRMLWICFTKAFDNGIGVNAGDSKLMLLGINLLLLGHNLQLLANVNAVEVDKKKVIITESIIRRDLQLEDANGVDLPNAAIFEQLTLMGAKTTTWNEFSSTMASAIICLATNQKFNFSKYIFDNMVKNVDSTKKQKPRKPKRKDTEIPQSSGPTEHIADEAANEENVPTHSNDPLLSGEDSLKLNDLMEICTKLQQRVLDLENTKTAQAQFAQVLSSKDEGLSDQEDASKQGRKIDDIDKDAEDVVEKEVSTADPVTTAGEVVTTANVVVSTTSTISVSTATTTVADEVEMTLAQTLIEIKSAKPKAVTTAATITTTVVTRPKDKGIVIQEQKQASTPASTPITSNIKDKGKAKMIELEKPLKKKEQIRLDEELALKLQAEEEQVRLASEKTEKVEEANISWDNVQAMIEADRLLAERLQAREQEELTDEEKARLFVELLEKRKKHFSTLRAQEKRNKPPTKAQKKRTMSTYLKHMAGCKQSQLKNKLFSEIQKLFDKSMTRVNMFVDMDTELVKESLKKAEAEMTQESSSKRAGDELKHEKANKQKVDDDKDREDLQQCFEIVTKEYVAIDAIPVVIVDYKIHRKGKQGYYEIMRADGSSKIYLLFSQLIKSFDREDLETLWKLVKAKHGNTRPEEGYERVL